MAKIAKFEILAAFVHGALAVFVISYGYFESFWRNELKREKIIKKIQSPNSSFRYFVKIQNFGIITTWASSPTSTAHIYTTIT